MTKNPQTDDASTPIDSPRRGRRRRRLFGLLLLVLIAAAGFAPRGAARFLEANGLTLSDEAGSTFRIRIGEASLGWFSPVRLRDVRIDDAAGQQLLAAPEVVSERSLVNLLTDRRRPGRFFVEKPTMTLVLRDDGSNLDDLLQALRGDGESRSLLNIGGSVTEGTVTVTDGLSTTILEDIQASARKVLGNDHEITLEWQSVVVNGDDRQPVVAAVDWHGPNDGLPFLSGVGEFAIDLAPIPLAPWQSHLDRWIPGLTVHSGTLEGRALITADFREAQSIAATGEIITRDVHGVALSADGSETEFRWPEEPLSFKLDGRQDTTADSIRIEAFNVESTPVGIASSGTVDDVSGACIVDVSGRLRYDVDRLLQNLAVKNREHLRVNGLRTTGFGIRGPLAKRDSSDGSGSTVDGKRHWDLERLAVSADLAWDRADIYGVVSEQASIQGRLQDGVLHVEPQNVPVSGGQYLASLDGILVDDLPVLSVSPGPALQSVQLSEEMCRLWLKFLSPVMADATRVSGRFSINLDGGEFPLEHLQHGQVGGVLHIHEAEARPGPFAEQVFGLVDMIRGLADRKSRGRPGDRIVMTLDDQQVPFVMADGRVRHEGLQLNVAGAAIRTSGTVGLDESLDLLVEVSLPESWFKQNAIGKALSSEPLRIPVRGTLDRPVFDQRVLRELTRKFAIEATGGLLKKLFD